MTTAKPDSVKTILIDSDVIFHFISSNCIDDLPEILYPHHCTILDYVYDEIAKTQFRKLFVDKLIKGEKLRLLNFPHNDYNIQKEFAFIKKKHYLIGEGERACMAVAKFTKDIIASSNFRDIVHYCDTNGILYIGTLDILSIAVHKGIYDENRCDLFIQNAIQHNKARFPNGVTQMRYYVPKDISFLL